MDISLWSTKWVIQWMLHIPGSYEIIIDVEKEAEENVFYFLSSKRENVFLNPNRDILDKYSKDSMPLVIIKNLVTDAPLQQVEGVQVPTLEKILVDLVVDKELLSAYQGKDLESIIENAFQYHTINKDRLLRYANRRGKREFVENLIQENFSNDFI